MKFPRSLLFLPLVVLCLIVLTAPPALADDWKPVNPADLALKAPVVEKDADAEAIFWEVRVEDVDEVNGDLIFQHYIRIKVFTERGRESQSYAQLMQDRLLVFKPAIVSRLDDLFLTKASRKHPVVLKSHAFTETVRVKLPEGFNVDELPDPLKLDTVFGNYASTYEVKDGQLIFTRTFTTRAATIPVEQYQSVRNFYERIRSAEGSPVVLARK